MKLTQAEISTLIRRIYNGQINPLHLPKKLYKEIANYLNKGVEEGFKATLEDLSEGSKDYMMLLDLKENIYIFSAAKTFNYVLSTEGLIVENNEVLPFAEFKKRALQVYDQYNVNWLEAEYNTAIGQASNARDWVGYEDRKEYLPLLKYVTIHDSNVSEVCKSIDGVIKPVDDSFWNTHSPLNHYQCRCHLDQIGQGRETDLSKMDIVNPSKEFSSNSGKTGEVFTKDHPYFDVPQKYKKFAKTNFGLDIPE